MADKIISPQRATLICEREGLTLPRNPHEERLLETGAKLYRHPQFGYMLLGYAYDGADTARYMGKRYENGINNGDSKFRKGAN